MSERLGHLYPIGERLVGDLRAHRYGLFEPAVDDQLAPFDDLDAVARHLLAIRQGRGMRVDDSALIWGDGEDDSRAAISVFYTLRDGSIDQTMTVVAYRERAGHLWQAIEAAKGAARTRAA